MHTTLTQVSELLATVYAGLFIGLVYEALRVLRRVSKAGKWVTAFLDLLFWAVATAVAAGALFVVNGGDVRLYSVAGFFLGALLFIFGASPLIGAVFRLLTSPFRALWHFLCKKRRNFSEEEGKSKGDGE